MKKHRRRKSVGGISSANRRTNAEPSVGNGVDAGDPKSGQVEKPNPESVELALNLAEDLYRHGRHDEIVKALKGHEADYPFKKHSLRQRYNRLLAYGYLVLSDPVRADKIALRGLADSPNSTDFRWLLTMAKSELREFDEVIRIGTEWLKLSERDDGDSADFLQRWIGGSDRACLCRKTATALAYNGRFDEAEKLFELALKADPQAPQAYLDLAGMLRVSGNHERATEVIDNGLRQCRHQDELTMFKSILKRRSTIAACLIVKDEEELLPGCLDSIRDWVDEIVVVDTGSTDQTVSISLSYGAKIFHQEWQNDFSHHRNFSIEQAESDWILIIDADERIPTVQLPNLLEIIECDQHHVIALNVVNVYSGDSKRISAPNSMRLFKRNLNLRYEGIVHNALMVPDAVEVFRAPICLEHLGYDLSPDKMKAKIARTRSLLEKRLEGDPNDGFAWFNLAQLFRSRLTERFDEYTCLVLKAAQRAVGLCHADDPKNRSYHLMALDQLAWTHHFLGNQEKAEQYVRQALSLKTDYLDPLILAGHIHAAKGDHEKAIDAYDVYLKAQGVFKPHEETDALILLHSDSRAEAQYRMAISSEQLNKVPQAKIHYRKALELDRFFAEANYALGMIYLKKNELTEAEKYLLRQFEQGQPKGRAALGLAEVFHRRNQPQRVEEYVQEAIRTGSNQPEVLKICLSYYQRTTEPEKVAELNGMILRSLSSTKGRATISAAMIVKDEQELLPGCLDSIKDWVDEIIMVDTGSTDRTVQIAESYGAKVFLQSWEGDFSKHRNYSIEQATGDWVFIIDADERFSSTDVVPLLELTRDTKHRIISINVFNIYGAGEHKLTSMNSVRFFRRELGLRYEGIVHNQINNPDRVPITRAPFSLEHLGYDLPRDKMDAKLERTKALLEKQIEDDPDFAFAWFNLAQLLRGELLEDYDRYAPLVIKAAQRAVQLTDPSNRKELPIHLMALDQLAWTWFYGDDFEKAEEYARKSLQLKSDYLDPLMLLGHIHSRKGNHAEAIDAYEDYLKVQVDFDERRELEALILYHPDSLATAHYGIATSADLLGNVEKARAGYIQTLKANPTYLQANLLLGKIHLRENDLHAAEKHFLMQFEKETDSVDSMIGVAMASFKLKQFDRAEEFFNKALELEPGNLSAIMNSGLLYLQTDRKSRADEFLKKAMADSSIDLSAVRRIAESYFRLGFYNDAAEVYERAIKSDPEAADLQNDLGNCFYKLNQYGKAKTAYGYSLQLPSGLPITHRNLGLALVKLNLLAEAMMELELYYQLDPDQHQILTVLSQLQAETGDFNSAIDSLERYLRLKPDDISALTQLSETYLVMGQKDAAVLGYRQALRIDPESEAIRDRLSQLESSPVTDRE